jgi:hypothetical protein
MAQLLGVEVAVLEIEESMKGVGHRRKCARQ